MNDVITQQINEIELQLNLIRSYLNKHYNEKYKFNPHTWDIICASMDVITDGSFAIEAYVSTNIPINTTGFYYLVLNGLFQHLFTQQDSIKSLYLELVPSHINTINADFKSINEIRTIRNCAFGHHTNRLNGKILSYINRNSIKQFTFQYESYSHENNTQIKKVIPVETIPLIINNNEWIIKHLIRIKILMKKF